MKVSGALAGELIPALVAAVSGATTEDEARNAFRAGFERLHAQLDLYPRTGSTPSAVFEAAAGTVSGVSANCLPLGIAIVMHLYPICALQCVPIAPWSAAWFRRTLLLKTIRSQALIVANTGSERLDCGPAPVVATRTRDGLCIDGTCDYMSLASVADLVLLKAPLAGSECTVLCAANLQGQSVRTGVWRFSDSMRLSDTSSVTFSGHRIPPEHCLVVPSDELLNCVSDYQRCWFHLFLSEAHLARLEWLQRRWGLARSTEWLVHLNEMSGLREYALRLLDDFARRREIERLVRTTAAMKLRASLLAQRMVVELRALEALRPEEVALLRSHAGELRYIRWQPTADEKVLRNLESEAIHLSALRVGLHVQ